MSLAHPSDSENWNPQEMKGLLSPAKPRWFNKYTRAPCANLTVSPKRLIFLSYQDSLEGIHNTLQRQKVSSTVSLVKTNDQRVLQLKVK